jgi:hypothetical protein
VESGHEKESQTPLPDPSEVVHLGQMGPKVRRISLRGLAQSVFLVFFMLIVAFLSIRVVVSLKQEWMYDDQDGDGVALIDDLDPDGDGFDVFSDPDADNDGEPNSAQAAGYALSMKNIPYDPIMGKLHNVLGKAGMVVCIDVPVRSWLRAGLSMPALLKQSAAIHPEWFKIDPSNHPDSPFFYRRVRNYYQLFQKHPGLVHDDKPQVGDWAFYGTTHIALVTAVSENGDTNLVEASPFKLRVAVSTIEEMEKTWGRVSFFGRIRRPE